MANYDEFGNPTIKYTGISIEDKDTYKHFPSFVMDPMLKDMTCEQVRAAAFNMEWEIQKALYDQKAKFNKIVEETNKNYEFQQKVNYSSAITDALKRLRETDIY